MNILSPNRQRQSPKGDRRRSELIACASHLFATRGVEATSFQDIAEALSMTKAAVFHHFPDKNRLIEAVIVTRMAEHYAAVLAMVDLAETPLAKIRTFAQACARRIDENRSDWEAASAIYWSIDREGSPAIIAARDRLEGLLRDLIRAAIAAGELRPVEPAHLGRLILAAINSVPRWLRPEGALRARAVIDLYLDMILEGVRARP